MPFYLSSLILVQLGFTQAELFKSAIKHARMLQESKFVAPHLLKVKHGNNYFQSIAVSISSRSLWHSKGTK